MFWLSIVLVGSVGIAEAEILTDKQEYHYGDTIVISGNAELEPREKLEIYFADPNVVVAVLARILLEESLTPASVIAETRYV